MSDGELAPKRASSSILNSHLASEVDVRKIFVSYARVNKAQVDRVVEHLGLLDYQTWIDSRLRGGQAWWDEILRNIADCDVFLPVVSRDSLNSSACQREFDWAEALGKPVLPVAVETPSKALPPRLSRLQIVDYSDAAQGERNALTLAGALANLPPAPPLPEQMPTPPEVPLSYLNDLAEVVSSQTPLDHDQQRQLLVQVEHALRSVDPHERQGGLDILERFSSRDNLYADVDGRLSWLKANTPNAGAPPAPAPMPPPASPAPPSAKAKRGKGRLALAAAVVVVAVACVVGYLMWSRSSTSAVQTTQTTKPLAQGASSGPSARPGPSAGQSAQTTSSDGQTVLPFPDLLGPRSVAVDSAGNVYVADRSKGVFELSAGAGTAVQLPSTGIGQPEGVAVDAANNVYITDWSRNTLWKLAPNATAPAAVQVDGLKCGEFMTPISLSNPTAVAVDGAGTIYLSDGACQGRVLSLAPGSSAPTVLLFSGLQNPGGVAVDSAGSLYVVNGTMGVNGQVLKLAPGSNRPAPLPFTGLSRPQAVAVDSAGNLYVSDVGNKQVLELAAGSSTATVVPYKFHDDPGAVAVDGSRNLYLTDGNRVVKLAAP